MRWTPLKTFFAGTAAVLGVGLGYLAFRKPKPKPKPGTQATPVDPRPESVPADPIPPASPEGISPFPGAAPANWRQIFNKGVEAVIEFGRTNEEIATSEDMQYLVGAKLFPSATWPPPANAQDWQKKIWSETRAILLQKSGTESWPFAGSRETADASIIFWITAARNVQHCLQLGLGDALAVRTCAANRSFPGLAWPPPSDARAWQRAAWERFVVAG